MSIRTVSRAAVLVACIGLLSTITAMADSFKTPEKAVTAYLDGVVAHDFGKIIAATAVDEMSTHFDFTAFTERLQVLYPTAPAPSSDPMFVAINKAEFTATIGRQVEFLTYGLTTATPVLQGQTVPMDGEGATAFAAAVDPAQLEGLTVDKIAVPKLALANGDIYRSNATKRAKTYGADEVVERVALVTFKDADYLIGFTVLRYGKGWGISDQTSSLADTGSMGNPKRITPGEFEDLLK